MYAGPFNLNIWLRRFVRSDLVDAYEKECLDIVNEYAGADQEALPRIVEKLNVKLSEMVDNALKIKRRQAADFFTSVSLADVQDMGWPAALDKMREDLIGQLGDRPYAQYMPAMYEEKDGILWTLKERDPSTIESE